MTTGQTRLAVVIPTRNRPSELATLLGNLEEQARRPDIVVVVDGSDEALRTDVREVVAAAKLPCRYVHHWPPSAAAQRNAGLSAVLPDVDLVALIDDDVILPVESFGRACDEIRRSGPEFIGFGLNPTDVDARRHYGRLKASWLSEALGLYSRSVGAVTRSGWHTRIRYVQAPTAVEWLTTCAVIWRAEPIRDLRFDEFFVQYSYLEDLDFSLQARSRGRFLILPEATYLHRPAAGGRKSRFWFGRIEVRNRYYIVRKHDLSEGRFWMGAGLRALLTIGSVLSGHPAESSRFVGNCIEMIHISGSWRMKYQKVGIR